MELEWSSLLAVSIAAAAVPALFALIRPLRVPAVVGELGAGIVLGRSGLAWIAAGGEGGPHLEFLFSLGLAFVLFLAGMETDPAGLSGAFPGGWRRAMRSPVWLAVAGLAISLALAFAVTIPLHLSGLLPSPLLVSFLIASTSIGVLLAVLGERGLLRQPFGQRLLVMAGVTDVATVLLLTIFFSTDRSSTMPARIVLSVGLLALGVGLFLALRFASRQPRLPSVMERLSGATSQWRIRASVTLMLVFVALASEFGLEIMLGSFMAGVIISGLGLPRQSDEYRMKMEAIGYGFFVPVFFVLAGSRLDIGALLRATERMLLIPILLVAILAIKTIPMWLYRREFTTRENLAGGVLQTAQLTLTVAGTEMGLRAEIIDEALASALVSVALINTIVAPIVFARLLPDGRRAARVTPSGSTRALCDS